MKRGGRSLAVLALLLASCAACAHQSGFGFDDLPRLHGFALCTTENDVAFVHASLWGTVEGEAVVAHEETHQRQHTRFDNCPAFWRHYASPAGRLAIEAEAFAVGRCVHRVRGSNLAIVAIRYEMALEQYFAPGHMPADSIHRTFALYRREVCP